MKKLFLSLFILSFSVPAYGHEAPCIKELWHIHVSTYEHRKNDCVDKAVNYCNILLANQYGANVVVGLTRDSDRPHAWVEISIRGDKYWIDPVYGLKCREAKKWRRKIWYTYHQGISKAEVRAYTGIILIYPDAPKHHVINF